MKDNYNQRIIPCKPSYIKGYKGHNILYNFTFNLYLYKIYFFNKKLIINSLLKYFFV